MSCGQEVQEPQVATEPSMEILQDSQPVVESTSSAQGPRRSSRIHHEPKRYGFLVTKDKTIELVDQDEPTTYHEAMMSPYSEKWLQAMKSDMQSMYDNQVLNLVDPPEGAKVIGCKWVHKIKHDMTFKSRLITKGSNKLMVLTMMRPFHLSLCLSLLGFFLLSLRTMITRFGKWMSKQRFLMETYSRMCT